MAFVGIMASIIISYFPIKHGFDFLATKRESLLSNNFYLTAFYIHITTSIFSIFFGVFQFIPFIIKEKRNIHKLIGKIYAYSILLAAAPSGLILAVYANGGLTSRVGFTIQCILWWFTTFIAIQYGIKKNVASHIDMMLRSYAITLAAFSLRSEGYILQHYFNTKPMETYTTCTWLSWVGNLLLIELLLYFGIGKQLLQKIKS